ncbi:hypothetical protein GCM10011428_60870 [Streptomyces violaceus]|uniref:hypothetical protein n=1 Tax=Streptomyces violaceus TaxID=1936 RepID=UPI003377F6D0
MSELGARASGQGRIFQTSGDQYIEEHHHHYDAGAGGPLFGRQNVPPAAAGPAAPDSVRMPLVGRAPGILRDREELRRALGAAVAGPGGEVHVVHGMGGCGKTALAHCEGRKAMSAGDVDQSRTSEPVSTGTVADSSALWRSKERAVAQKRSSEPVLAAYRIRCARHGCRAALRSPCGSARRGPPTG